jgi:hypothetical protein
MPWWSESLWAFQSNIRASLKLKRDEPSQCNIDAYVRIKASYQRVLRAECLAESAECWLKLLTTNLALLVNLTSNARFVNKIDCASEAF